MEEDHFFTLKKNYPIFQPRLNGMFELSCCKKCFFAAGSE